MKTAKTILVATMTGTLISLSPVKAQNKVVEKAGKQQKVKHAAKKHPKQSADFRKYAVNHPKEAKAVARDANNNPGTTQKYYKAAQKNPDKYREIKRDAENNPARAKKMYKRNKGQLKKKSPGENYKQYKKSKK
jgi:hypothetical protein